MLLSHWGKVQGKFPHMGDLLLWIVVGGIASFFPNSREFSDIFSSKTAALFSLKNHQGEVHQTDL